MILPIFLFSFFSLIEAQNAAVSIADVPQCAKTCLTKSTVLVNDSCVSSNFACLCNNPLFISTLYCCLSTQCNASEQATAITFNQQQCAAVNVTAPDSAGCAMPKSTSSASGAKSASTITASNGVLYSTVASVESEPATQSMNDQITATFAGQALLTGSCTAPLFAIISATGLAEMYPQVGCGSTRQDCCPSGDIDAVLTQCPQDYFTTANACCPSGYSVFSSAIGMETPCFKTAATILIPASTQTISGLSVITDRVFTKRYILATVPESSWPSPYTTKKLSTGGIVGIAVASGVLFLAAAVILFWIQRRKTRANQTQVTAATFPPEEPALLSHRDQNAPHELASPEVMGHRTSFRGIWPLGGLLTPPSDHNMRSFPIIKNLTPQELPGSTFMNEHHPIFQRPGTAVEMSNTGLSLRTPNRSPRLSAAESPLVIANPTDYQARVTSPSTISSIGSPRLPRTITDQSINSNKE